MIKHILFFLGCFSAFQSLHSGIYDSLYQTAVIHSPLIRKIHEDSLQWQAQEQKELSALLAFIQHTPVDPEKLKLRVQNALHKDIHYFSQLTPRLRSISTYAPLITNKMAYGAQLALQLCESSFYNILDGYLPHGYDITPPIINTVGDETHIYASGRGIALKHLLLRTAMEMTKRSLDQMQPILRVEPQDSTFIQYTPLPTGFNDDGLDASPYLIKNMDKHYLAVIHNGYTFGGHLGMPEKCFGPQDCSSFVGKYVGADQSATQQPITTMSQAIHYQFERGFFFINPQIRQLVEHYHFLTTALQKVIEPWGVYSPWHVAPGLIHAERLYKYVGQGLPWDFLGTSGHTSFVLGPWGKGNDSKVITLGAGRDLEGTNRDFIFGVDARPYQSDKYSDDKRMVMYFRKKD